MISDGKMVGRPTPLSAFDVVAYIEKAFFSVLLPHGWALGGTTVFVLDSGYPCGTVDPEIAFFNTARDGVNAWSCVDDKLYYLAGLSGMRRCVQIPACLRTLKELQALTSSTATTGVASPSRMLS
jgi:hypothetical protein